MAGAVAAQTLRSTIGEKKNKKNKGSQLHIELLFQMCLFQNMLALKFYFLLKPTNAGLLYLFASRIYLNEVETGVENSGWFMLPLLGSTSFHSGHAVSLTQVTHWLFQQGLVSHQPAKMPVCIWPLNYISREPELAWFWGQNQRS